MVHRQHIAIQVHTRAEASAVYALLRDGASFRVESIIGTIFRGRVLRTTKVAQYDAVVPEVTGSAWTVGRSELWVVPDDPLRDGFVLR